MRSNLLPTLIAAVAAFALPLCAEAQETNDTSTAVYDTPQGKLIVHSSQPAPRDYGPAPSFEQLAGGKRYIMPADADAYPPLGNDFLYADSNHDGRISKSEYGRWVASPR